MIVLEVLAEDPPKMLLAKDDDMVKAIAPDRADHPFAVKGSARETAAP